MLKIDDEKFEIAPYVFQDGDKYYIGYKLKDPKNNEVENRLILMSRETVDKGYYFLSGPTSFREMYNLNEVEIQGELLNLLKNDHLFWLNPNGSEIRLIKQP